MTEQFVVTEPWLNLVRKFPANANSAAVLALLDEIERLKQELRCESIDNSAVCQDLRNVIVEYQKQIASRDQKIEQLEAELQKRPIVYCAKNKSTGKMLTLGGNVVLMHSVQRSAWEDSDWTTEVYTGEQQS